MKYTVQTFSESGSFGEGKPQVVNGKKAIHAVVENWSDLHDQVGSSPEDAYALVWKGEYTDTTDLYPDYQARLGKRGGLVLEPC